jgi:isopenicillin-N epimerase
MKPPLPDPSPLASHWSLDPDLIFLNHGSFGACPAAVLEVQSELRARLEREPVLFLGREIEGRLDQARAELALFLGADPLDLAFVPNATTGVNAVIRSLPFAPGDEILTTDHAYNACRATIDFTAERTGARVVIARVPFPLAAPGQVLAAILAAATPRTRLALVDWITSPTGLIFPIEKIVRELDAHGIDTLVDGAHAPGMVPVDLGALGAAYTTGNCHKWLCAPKGAGFLHVRRDRQAGIHPTTLSHGVNSPRTDRSRFHLEFDWMGTADPTAYLAVPAAIRTMASLVPGGWPEVMRLNRALALAGRDILLAALDLEPPCPADMVGSLAVVPLPDSPAGAGAPAPGDAACDPLQAALFRDDRIEVPIVAWPAAPHRLARISAQLYNSRSQVESLARALVRHLRVP